MKVVAQNRKNRLNPLKNVRSGVDYNLARLCAIIMAKQFPEVIRNEKSR